MCHALSCQRAFAYAVLPVCVSGPSLHPLFAQLTPIHALETSKAFFDLLYIIYEHYIFSWNYISLRQQSYLITIYSLYACL